MEDWERRISWLTLPKAGACPVSSCRSRVWTASAFPAPISAARLRPGTLTGVVVHGQQLGRTLGIPTANLHLPQGLAVPKFGVYACRVTVDGESYPAVTNIGTRPTVGGTGITVEAWILDYTGNLYGRQITLEFYRFLRGEQKFESLSALQAEIRRNAEQTRSLIQRAFT